MFHRFAMKPSIWTHSEILERGVKMLGFMAERWDISLGEDIKKTLTQVNFGVETSV